MYYVEAITSQSNQNNNSPYYIELHYEPAQDNTYEMQCFLCYAFYLSTSSIILTLFSFCFINFKGKTFLLLSYNTKSIDMNRGVRDISLKQLNGGFRI